MDARKTGSITKDDGYEVSDPTDWLGTPLSDFMIIEQSFRCHVCKDFYDTPMLTSCSHTFCSLCVRRALAVDGKCPMCRKPDQESRLRGNWAIREAVDAFVLSRPGLLESARRPATVAQVAAPLKRKAPDEAYEDGHEYKRTRMSTRSSRTKGADTTAAMMRDEVDIEDTEDVVEYQPEDGLVECPICLRRMKEEKVSHHMDTTCPGLPQPETRWSPTKSNSINFPASKSTANHAVKIPERLASLNYSLLRDQPLRKKLAELGISTVGSRQLLESRHREWVMIWNANCDSARPKKKHDLLKDLDEWERTQGGKAPTMSHSATLGAQIKDKNFDGAAWGVKNTNSFKDLIANARRSQKKAEDHSREASTSSNDTVKPAEQATNGVVADSLPAPEQVEGNSTDGIISSPLRFSESVGLTIPSSSQTEPVTPTRRHLGPSHPSRSRFFPTNQTSVAEVDQILSSSQAGTTPS